MSPKRQPQAPLLWRRHGTMDAVDPSFNSKPQRHSSTPQIYDSASLAAVLDLFRALLPELSRSVGAMHKQQNCS